MKVRTMNKLGCCAKRKHITLERYIKELQAVINMSIQFMIDYNFIHVVNTPITERPNVCIIMNGYSYIAPHGFSVKLKREWLNRKIGFFVEEEVESEHAKELQKKKVWIGE